MPSLPWLKARGGLSTPWGKRRNLAEPSHQVQHTIHIAPVKDAPVDHRPATLVISTYHLHQVTAEIVPEPVQIICTHVDVIHEPIRVTTYARAAVDILSCVGHDLHDANSAVAGNHMLIPATLLPCN